MSGEVVVTQGKRLDITQTGKQRQRFSKLFCVFIEFAEDGTPKLMLRNYPSQRIMFEWLDANGWLAPERAGSYLIFSGKPKTEISTRIKRGINSTHMQEAITERREVPKPKAEPLPKEPILAAAESPVTDLHETPEDHANLEGIVSGDGIVL